MGAGSIGSVIGAFLQKSGHDVAFVGMGPHIEAIREGPLTVSGIWGTHRLEKVAAFTSVEEVAASMFEPDWTLLCVKSYDTEKALTQIRESGLVQHGIISMQNGLGNLEMISTIFPNAAVGSRIIFGAMTEAPGNVKVTVCADDVLLGHVTGKPDGVEAVVEAFRGAGLPCRYEPAIITYIWDKVLYNTTLNALATVLRTTYGELGKNPDSRGLMEHLVREFYLVAEAEGVALVSDTPEAYLERFYRELLPPTAGHRSSMQEDMDLGRRTEIDAMNGRIWMLAEKHGLSTPFHEAYTRSVRFLENADPA